VGDSYWTADNPPRGAILDLWIGDEAVGEPLTLEIVADDGSVLRQVADTTAVRGAHRYVWDLRHESPRGADGEPSRRFRGRFVVPGSYAVRLTVGTEVHVRSLEVRMDPGVTVDPATRRSLDEALSLQAALVGAAAVAGAAVDTVMAQAQAVETLLGRTPSAPADVGEAARQVSAEARRLQVILNGPGAAGLAQQETVLPLAPLISRLYTSTESWTGAPTADQRGLTTRAHGEVADLVADLRTLLDGALRALRRRVEDAGLAWPAGEAPVLPAGLVPTLQP
jgi:hypothetical protein